MKTSQAIILAAGKSTRTHPLTIKKPKALLPVGNKPIIQHNLDSLQGLVKEAIIVRGFEGHQIEDLLGKKYGKIQITYVDQGNQLGTGHALAAAESRAKDRFVLLMGDDLYSKQDIKKCLSHERAILCQTVPDISQFGMVKERAKQLLEIAEKSPIPKEGLANTGSYVLTRDIFAALRHMKKSERGEYEITEAINMLAKKEKISVEIAGEWIPITYPWSLLEANRRILEGMKIEVKGTVEKGATLKGSVSIGKGTIVKAGSYIEGPTMIGEGCSIGPNCYIRAYTTIGNNCLVGNASEVKESIIMNGSHIGHLSYVGDSVLAENVNFGASTITANLRHDNQGVKSHVKGELIDTKRRKLGAIIGEGVHTGIHTAICPGRKIWPGMTTFPGDVVKKDIES